MAWLAAILWVPSAARAQTREPIPIFVADIRGSLIHFGTDHEAADARGIPAERLPTSGFGVDVGAHVYPLRFKVITFGFGASFFTARGEWHADPTTQPDVPDTIMRFKAFNPQISLNFGSGRGWSYLSGGIFRSTQSIDRATDPRQTSPGIKTINYGGGARWFPKPHVAFSVEGRFYAVNSSPPTATYPGNGRRTFIVLNVGVSIQ